MKQSSESFAQNMIDNFEPRKHPDSHPDVSQIIEEKINEKMSEVIKERETDVSRETSITNDDVELEETIDESNDEILND